MLLPVVIILIYCNTLALSQFYVPEFPELQMVPVYMPVMPEIPITNTDATHNSDKGKTYYKTFNDKLPGGSGRGHVYEHYAPGHHEYSNSYNSFQSFGDPAGFRKQIFNTPNGQMLTYSIPDGLKVAVIGMNPMHQNCPEILHWFEVRRVREPVHSVHVIVLQPGLGASTGVDCGMILLEREADAWKSL
uniref:Uncharacterized protein n=1 Tax=Heterorhabditis bacteriophora TaxID=37862 RepID=A0A1I7XN66_HETBA